MWNESSRLRDETAHLLAVGGDGHHYLIVLGSLIAQRPRTWRGVHCGEADEYMEGVRLSKSSSFHASSHIHTFDVAGHACSSLARSR